MASVSLNPVQYNLHLDSKASLPHMFIISGEITAKRGDPMEFLYVSCFI